MTKDMNASRIVEVLEILGDKCQHCESAQAEILHACAVVREIYDGPNLKCNCCSECALGCANDI